jgi:hypothetical protein
VLQNVCPQPLLLHSLRLFSHMHTSHVTCSWELLLLAAPAGHADEPL